MGDEELYVNDPGRVLNQANQLTEAGSTLYSAWTGARADLVSAHSAQPPPWGTDRVGQAFLKGYGDPTGNSAGLVDKDGKGINGVDSPAAKIMVVCDYVAPRLRDIGPAITNIINGVVDDDEVIAGWFKQDAPEAPPPPGETTYPPDGPSLHPH